MLLTLVFIILACLLLNGCASGDLEKRLSAINSQPYLSDQVQTAEYQHVKLEPLTKYDGSQASLIMRHKQHKADRLTVTHLDEAMAAKSREVAALKGAMKSIEVADRATLRANAYLEDGLEQERKAASFNDIKHTVFEAILGVALIVVGAGP